LAYGPSRAEIEVRGTMNDVEPPEQRVHRRRKEGLAWSTLLLLVAGYFSFGIGALMTMASDGCRSTTERPICNTATQHLVAFLPVGAAVAGLLVGVIGGGLAVRRAKSPAGWIGASWTLLVAGVLISMSIASA
jgi:hypothetical protein